MCVCVFRCTSIAMRESVFCWLCTHTHRHTHLHSAIKCVCVHTSRETSARRRETHTYIYVCVFRVQCFCYQRELHIYIYMCCAERCSLYVQCVYYKLERGKSCVDCCALSTVHICFVSQKIIIILTPRCKCM